MTTANRCWIRSIQATNYIVNKTYAEIKGPSSRFEFKVWIKKSDQAS